METRDRLLQRLLRAARFQPHRESARIQPNNPVFDTNAGLPGTWRASSASDQSKFLKTPFNETAARFSPYGHFAAYVSDESGRPEIYVPDFPKGTSKWQISANAGIAPP